MAETLTPDELAGLFLFERLERGHLEWLSAHGQVRDLAAGERIFAEGEPAELFVVMLDGTVAMSRRVRGGEMETTRAQGRGTYFGALDQLMDTDGKGHYTISATAVTEARVFTLPVTDMGTAVREWFPMAGHLLAGVLGVMSGAKARIAERERLDAIGTLTAGLTHELNNPAAAAVRAVAALRDHIACLRQRLDEMVTGSWRPDALRAVLELQQTAVARAAEPHRLTPLQTSDREDELLGWLEEHDVAEADDLAAALVGGGLDVAYAEHVAEVVDPEHLPAAMAWLGETVEIESLLAEITDASDRISGLLAAAKQYSQMDRAPQQRVNLHELLDSTLTMLKHKIGSGVRVVTEYEPGLPPVEVHAAELNQVWTNLIDNAVDAMGGRGTLTVRTRADGPAAVVEICDTGPGIPPDVRSRVFEPFFTTKPVGKGTGLGLDISWRIVVERHAGSLRVESEPGDTRFEVRLPLS
jgi:signal transduction histidine kinase